MTEKPIVWIGSSLEDLRALPKPARSRAGYELRRIQHGLMPTDWKPMPGIGPGVQELRIQIGRQLRVFYVARFKEAIYVLHAFEKKSRKTSRQDLEKGKSRLAAAVRHRGEN